MSGGQPFPIDPVLVGVVQAYRNGKLIADEVLPRLNPTLTAEKFTWWYFDFEQFITLTDTKVGRKSEPNRVEFNAKEKEDKTEDYGLDDIVPNVDAAQAANGYDPVPFAAQSLMDLVLLDREVRVAAKTMNPAMYGANNKETLVGSDQFSHVDSKPIVAIAEAADKMVIRPNRAACSRTVWTALRTNPSILRALTPSGAQDGYASKRAVADLLELDDIDVGEGWLNISKPGQLPVRARVWPNKLLLHHRATLANSMAPTPTFGWTAQFGTRVSGTIAQPTVGLRGSNLVRSGESVKEVIAAPDLGYLFEGVI